jgi:hypothetical protein
MARMTPIVATASAIATMISARGGPASTSDSVGTAHLLLC